MTALHDPASTTQITRPSLPTSSLFETFFPPPDSASGEKLSIDPRLSLTATLPHIAPHLAGQNVAHRTKNASDPNSKPKREHTSRISAPPARTFVSPASAPVPARASNGCDCHRATAACSLRPRHHACSAAHSRATRASRASTRAPLSRSSLTASQRSPAHEGGGTCVASSRGIGVVVGRCGANSCGFAERRAREARDDDLSTRALGRRDEHARREKTTELPILSEPPTTPRNEAPALNALFQTTLHSGDHSLTSERSLVLPRPEQMQSSTNSSRLSWTSALESDGDWQRNSEAASVRSTPCVTRSDLGSGEALSVRSTPYVTQSIRVDPTSSKLWKSAVCCVPPIPAKRGAGRWSFPATLGKRSSGAAKAHRLPLRGFSGWQCHPRQRLCKTPCASC